jgi:signal transduction histidine kinase
MGQGNLDLRDPLATTVFRVLQESLTNAAKHSHATQIEVVLERERDDVVLTVEDNGKGFAVDAPPPRGSFGLLGLRERATLVAGTVTIESRPGEGTRVELRVPVAREAETA